MSNENNIAPINEDLNVVKYEIEDIKQKIYTIRGKQVLLDSDIAKLYEVETKKLNQAVKRNIERLTEEFCFQLNEIEMKNLRSQFVTSSLNKSNYGGRRYLTYAFTEQGVAMLSTVLHSDKAIRVSISIMKAFTEMRNFMITNSFIFERLTEVKYTEVFHDRFLILDKKYIYHIGASIKDVGKKCFGITLIKYEAIIKDILERL